MRGLNAPPRSRAAPERFTSSATSQICASLSTEQGPAMTEKLPPPILALPTVTTVSSGWNLPVGLLVGLLHPHDPLHVGVMEILSMSTAVVSPTRPRMVHPTPLVMPTSRFIFFSFATSASCPASPCRAS